jgi:hypothetical protein
MRTQSWTPDQQRTTPQERRAAQHPGNEFLVLRKLTIQISNSHDGHCER